MADNTPEREVVYVTRPKNRPIEFTTVLILYILLGVGVALTIHFILLSTSTYNWLGN
ncbi:MAG: light-harvesting protein [Anaerolineae bacterium]|nr:light-harvesting protein [Anaerolineae bacterium]